MMFRVSRNDLSANRLSEELCWSCIILYANSGVYLSVENVAKGRGKKQITFLGKPVCTNIDEFLEKFKTAFDLPPPFWEKCCDFFRRKFLEQK